MEEKTMVRLTGLWKNTSKTGEQYLAGGLTHTSRLLIFKNHKTTENAPDYVAFVAPKERKENQEQGKAPTGP